MFEILMLHCNTFYMTNSKMKENLSTYLHVSLSDCFEVNKHEFRNQFYNLRIKSYNILANRFFINKIMNKK